MRVEIKTPGVAPSSPQDPAVFSLSSHSHRRGEAGVECGVPSCSETVLCTELQGSVMQTWSDKSIIGFLAVGLSVTSVQLRCYYIPLEIIKVEKHTMTCSLALRAAGGRLCLTAWQRRISGSRGQSGF